MIEISGAQIVFWGADDQVLACLDVRVRLEQLGQITLVVEAWEVPLAVREAVAYQIRLPMPVMFEASPLSVMLVSQRMPVLKGV